MAMENCKRRSNASPGVVSHLAVPRGDGERRRCSAAGSKRQPL